MHGSGAGARELVTERADVYAAALLAWRLATGRTPFARFKDDEFELLRAMRNPHLRPLAALRPDLPEPILSAIARALEPEAEKRTISAEELRAIVRANVDTESGQIELGVLLGRWRPSLVKTIARDEATSRSKSGSEEDAEDRHKTGNYEEAALAFDNEGVLDGPTFETYSLPSDAAILATLPVEGAIEVAMPVPSAGAPSARGADSGPPLPPPATIATALSPLPPPPATIATTFSPPPPPPAPVPFASASPPSARPQRASSIPPTVRPRDVRPRGRWIPLAVAILLALAIVCAIAAHVAK